MKNKKERRSHNPNPIKSKPPLPYQVVDSKSKWRKFNTAIIPDGDAYLCVVRYWSYLCRICPIVPLSRLVLTDIPSRPCWLLRLAQNSLFLFIKINERGDRVVNSTLAGAEQSLIIFACLRRVYATNLSNFDFEDFWWFISQWERRRDASVLLRKKYPVKSINYWALATKFWKHGKSRSSPQGRRRILVILKKSLKVGEAQLSLSATLLATQQSTQAINSEVNSAVRGKSNHRLEHNHQLWPLSNNITLLSL